MICPEPPDPGAPEASRWDRLYSVAADQAGHFTTAQAAEAGYSPQLLDKYLRNRRVARGVSRDGRPIVNLPEWARHRNGHGG